MTSERLPKLRKLCSNEELECFLQQVPCFSQESAHDAIALNGGNQINVIGVVKLVARIKFIARMPFRPCKRQCYF